MRGTAKHQENKQQTGQIEAGDQLPELYQGADAIFSYGKRHGTKCPDRCQFHDHVDDPENNLGEAVDDIENSLTLLTDMMQGKTKQHRKQQHLENIAAGKGADHAGRDHVQQEGDDAL